jgi:hypothetical protein
MVERGGEYENKWVQYMHGDVTRLSCIKYATLKYSTNV